MSPGWPRIIPPLAPAPGRAQPLRGVELILTRPPSTAGAMAEEMAAAGAEVLEAPAIELIGLVEKNAQEVINILPELRARHGWLILPGKAAIGYFKEVLRRLNPAAPPLAGVRIATVGRASADALTALGLSADFVPPLAGARSLGALLPAAPGTLAAIVGSADTRPELPAELEARGIAVRVLPLYAPRPCVAGLAAIRRALAERPARLLLVASPSAVDALLDDFAAAGVATAPLRWVAIGPTTHGRLIAHGIDPTAAACAAAPTAEALIAAATESLGAGKQIV